jgi:hypothetical protein
MAGFSCKAFTVVCSGDKKKTCENDVMCKFYSSATPNRIMNKVFTPSGTDYEEVAAPNMSRTGRREEHVAVLSEVSESLRDKSFRAGLDEWECKRTCDQHMTCLAIGMPGCVMYRGEPVVYRECCAELARVATCDDECHSACFAAAMDTNIEDAWQPYDTSFLQTTTQVQNYISTVTQEEKNAFKDRWSVDAGIRATATAAGIASPDAFWNILDSRGNLAATEDSLAVRRKILKTYWTVDQIGRYDTRRCRNYTAVQESTPDNSQVISTFILHSGDKISVFLGQKDLAGGNSKPVTRGSSSLNHPTNCAVQDNKVYVVDTLNHQLRRTTGVNKPCLFDPGPNRNLFDAAESLAFFEALQDIYQKCGADNTEDNALFEELGVTFKKAAIDYLVNGNEEDILKYVCIDDSDCGAIGLTRLNEAKCKCRTAFEEAVKSPVFIDCPSDDAANDDWHKISSLLFACYVRLLPKSNNAGGVITAAGKAAAETAIRQFVPNAADGTNPTLTSYWDGSEGVFGGTPEDPDWDSEDFYSLQT